MEQIEHRIQGARGPSGGEPDRQNDSEDKGVCKAHTEPVREGASRA